MTTVALRSLSKVFGAGSDGAVVAVDDLDLDIADGEFIVLVGPSGCGKTTTLRMIGGLETPTEGSVSFDDVVVNDVDARNRDVAMVFQDFALYPHMTVERNLGFGLRREGNDRSAEEIDARVREVAEMLEIEDLLDQHPSSLSGGQKQRVALGRAIVREPRLFLFDEPLANLDAKLRKTMRTEILELQSAVDVTSVYVTHNQEEAMTMADRIAVMNDGELQQVGTPDEVFNRPTNVFVAGFIGSPSINLFEAAVAGTVDGYELDTGAFTFEVPGEAVPDGIDPASVTIGIRPQDLQAAEGAGADALTMETEVGVIEPLGTDAIVHAEAAGERVTAMMEEYQRFDQGESLTFAVDPNHVYLFDGADGTLLKGRRAGQAIEGEPTADA